MENMNENLYCKGYLSKVPLLQCNRPIRIAGKKILLSILPFYDTIS